MKLRRVLSRVAWRATWGVGRSRRGVTLVTNITIVAATIILIGGLSAVSSELLGTDRQQQLARSPATSEADIAFYTKSATDSTIGDGRSIRIEFAARAAGGEIPGVPSGAFGWYVSPQLMEALADSDALRQRFPNAQMLGRDGLGYGDELHAIRVLEQADNLDTRWSHRQGAGFPARLDFRALAVGFTIFVVLPALTLFWVLFAGLTRDLQRRLNALSRLGASRLTRLMVAAVGIGSGILPGYLLGVAGWAVLAPRLGTIPFVGSDVLVGDLRISPTIVVIASALLMIPVASRTVWLSRLNENSSLPAIAAPRKPRLARLVPLVCGAALMTTSGVVDNRHAFIVFFVGSSIIAVGLPIALPAIVWRIGDSLASGTTDFRQLIVGRRLQAGSRIGVGLYAPIAVMIATGAFGYVWTTSLDDPPRDDGTPGVWLNVPTDAVDHVSQRAEATNSLAVVAFDPRRNAYYGDCQELAAAGAGATCEASTPMLQGPLRRAPLEPSTESGDVEYLQLLVSNDSVTLTKLQAEIANMVPPVGMLDSAESGQLSSPLENWIFGGLKAVVATVVLAMVVVATQQPRDHRGVQATLTRIGMDPREQRSTLTRTELAAGLTHVGVGTFIGAVTVVTFAFLTPLPRSPWLMLFGLTSLGAMAVVGAAVATSRQLTRSQDGLYSD